MPQRQLHRGKHPQDAGLFNEKWLPVLRAGVRDLSYLLTRGYSENAASKLVGDHYQLATRQRNAVMRAACSDASRRYRRRHELLAEQVRGKCVALDGYNVLIGVESALSNAILFRCRDGCVRDIAGIHGSYHTVQETCPALQAVGAILERLGVQAAEWYLDAPVSNSGRLRALMLNMARTQGWRWRVELAGNPDKILAESRVPVVTTDGVVLDRAGAWLNFNQLVLDCLPGRPSVLDLRPAGKGTASC